MKWLLWPLFLDDVAGGDVRVHWPLRLPNLESNLGRLLWLAAAVACVAGVVYAYRREPDYVSAKRRRTLTVLRSLGALVLLFVTTGAFLETSTVGSSQGTLAFMFDVSKSMSIVDRRVREEEIIAAARILGLSPEGLSTADKEEIDGTSRADMVKRAVANKELSPFRRIGRKYKVEAFTFGQSPQVTPLDLLPYDAEDGALAGLPPPEEPATQLGGPLREAVRRLKGQYVVGVVPFTDGSWNRGEDPFIAAQDLGAPVYPIGVGLPQTRDVEIPFIFAENVVFKGDTFPMYVRIKQRGYSGQKAQLLVKCDDVVVREDVVTFGDMAEWTHTVEITPEREGTFTYSAEIQPFEDEMSVENNSRTKPGVRVIDKRIQVLVVENSPRWEFRFLKSVLEADDKRLKPTFVMHQADEDLVRQRGSGYRPDFPATPEDLRRYNLIVLGNVMSGLFTRNELEDLEQYVRKDGGALLVIAGRNHTPDSYEDTPLVGLLPVEFQPQPQFRTEDESLRSTATGYTAVLTPEGKRSTVLRFAADPGENEALWQRTAEMFWYYPAERLKPGATALLVHPTASGREGPVPLIAHHRYGKGQVMYFGTDEMWRWRYRPGAEYHRRMWGQAVTFLSMAHLLGETNRIQIETDRAEYAVGDKVKVIARVLDEAYNNLVAESVQAVVERGGLDQEEVVLAAARGQPGVFQGEFKPAIEGQYRVTILGEEDEAEHYFTAASPQIEFDDPGMREELLKQMAAESSGEFMRLEELDQLVEKLEAKKHKLEPRREERALWNAPGIVILVTLLLGAEWFLRKRSDLL
jgi:hypothetical protein